MPFLLLGSTTLACGTLEQQEIETMERDTTGQAQIIQTYLKEGAWNYHYVTNEWQEWIDKGLEQDSTIAFLWQQKALPYWKTRRYDLAISCYDRAVLYDRKLYLSRLGFLKCVFAKQYHNALSDIQAYHTEFGETYENDHSLSFYEALCYIGLAEFEKAKAILKPQIENEEAKKGKKWVHYLDRFYLAICHYELKDYLAAIEQFDLILEEYDTFSDAQFWKGKCLIYLEKNNEGESLMKEGYENYKRGFTFNEASSLYEFYPYQVTWEWPHLVK